MVQKRIWLINIRKAKGLTQEEVATKAGVSRVYYNLLEANLRTPSVDAAKKISDVLGIEWHSFFEPERFGLKLSDQASITE